jgi:hypothetical protein
MRATFASGHVFVETSPVDGQPQRGEVDGYEPAADAAQPQRSRVSGRTFRIGRTRNRAGRWDYRLAAD